MYRKIISLLILSSFVFYLTGCTSMRYVSPDQISEVEQVSSVWVTMVNGTRYEMREPKVEDSKLVGYIEPYGYKEVDTSEIESLGVKELNEMQTIALGVLGIMGAVFLIVALSDEVDESEPCPT